jgi:V-type H+-transporting ATPase subunit D
LKKVQGKKKERAALEEEENARKLLAAREEETEDTSTPVLQAAHESGQLDLLGDEEDEDIIF